jgi:diguanylate cyclase (GGDEF)-like protein
VTGTVRPLTPEPSSLRRQLSSRAGRLVARLAGVGRELTGRRDVAAEVDLFEAQLRDFQSTVADLMDTSEVGDALARVSEHACRIVNARRLLLAVRLDPDEPVRMHAKGFEPEEAKRLAPLVLDAEPGRLAAALRGEPRHGELLVAEVASPARQYGRLVAFSAAVPLEHSRQLLESYARLAATTLDASMAIETAAARRRTAERLGQFAARLIRERDTAGVAQATVEAALDVMGSDRATLMAYDEATGCFSMVATTGLPPELADRVKALVIGPHNYRAVARTLEELDEPRVRHRDGLEADRLELFSDLEVGTVAMVPVRTQDRYFGVLFTSWSAGRPAGRPHEHVRLLNAVGHQAAGAWEKATLLEQVHRQASLDPLTGLANRRVFTEVLASLMGAHGGRPAAVLFCDLDRFKEVNDLLGHGAGDELLVEVGHRLAACVRSDDLVARLGGDEFTVLLREVDEEWSPLGFAAKIREALEEPVQLEGSSVAVHLSIGAVVAAPGSLSVKEVLRRADAAMYAAKSGGGDRLLVFEEHMLATRFERLDLEASLAAAVAAPEGSFSLLYQPQVELGTGAVVGVEALVRWHHPERGLLAPGAFLPVAEETGLVVPIDLYVLDTALAEARRWRGEGRDHKVAVNFSAGTLQSPGIVDAVRAALDHHHVPGSGLEVELAESSTVADPECLGTVRALGELGVTIAIDDVGTGYSSLALLHLLPAHRLKIDRSFVQRIDQDAGARSVVEAVLLLADRLGYTAVAEGIETRAQATELRALGCRLGQGCLYARPIEPDRLRPLLASLLGGDGDFADVPRPRDG